MVPGDRVIERGPEQGGRRGGFGGPGGGPPMQQEIKLVEKFDMDGNERLDVEERKAAREYLAKERAEGRLGRGFGRGGRQRGGGFGGPPPGGPDGANPPGNPGVPGAPGERGVGNNPPDGRRNPGPGREARPEGPGGFSGPPGGGGGFGRRENQPPAEPGRKLTPADVKSQGDAPFYDTAVIRTLFLDFEGADWEKEMADFKNTDVEMPAKLTVDGRVYKDVGVHYRGASSFMMVPEDRKRSLNVSLDFVHTGQNVGGYRTLNLLNSNGDPTFLRAVLYHQIAREYIPAPKANWVQVVINGESWGLYVNVEQFNKDFVAEWFGTTKGARWKAPGRPNGNSGLEYLGDDVAEYRRRFEIKSKDDPESWKALIGLCRVLNQTPAEQLEEKLSPILDIDGALKFLALENVFINTDGYWTRASDYSLYRGTDGKFHIIPHDVNETFRSPGGPGMRSGGSEEGGMALDPLAGSGDANKPLLSKLLAVPALKERYLRQVRDISEKWLDWGKLGPIAEKYHALIAEEVKLDTRKLSSFEAFQNGIGKDTEEQGSRGPRRSVSLKSFVEQRRAYLLNHPALRGIDPKAEAPAKKTSSR